MTNYTVIKKLLGEIHPVGESNEDEKRLDNLKETIAVVELLLADIFIVSRNQCNPQHSMKVIALAAHKFIKEIVAEYVNPDDYKYR